MQRRFRKVEERGDPQGNFEMFYKKDMHFTYNCILSEEAPFKFSIKVYKDDEDAATIMEEEFTKILKEKWEGELVEWEMLDKGPVFDVMLNEASKEDAFKFYKDMKHIRAENSDNIFVGHTFNVFFRLPVDKFEEYADKAAATFEDAKKEFGESDAHQRQFPDVKAQLEKMRPRRDGRDGPKIHRNNGGPRRDHGRDDNRASKKELGSMGFGGGPKMFFNKHKEVEI